MASTLDRPHWLALTRSGLLALLSGAGLLLLAARHPLAPMAALALGWGWVVVCAWQPRCWLLAVPALLPLASAAPWTGWQIFDEFDLLLLATLCGGHARLAWELHDGGALNAVRSSDDRPWLRWALGLALFTTLIALLRGLWPEAAETVDAGARRSLAILDSTSTPGFWDVPLTLQLHGDALSPFNALRVGKSLLLAAALLPLWQRACRQNKAGSMSAQQLFAAGMAWGLAGAVLAASWERWRFTGLLNFTTPYRATGWFWEMHEGGAALEAYLALTLPFAVLVLMRARGAWARTAAAILLAGGIYATATTFSRSVLGAVLLPNALLLLVWTMRPDVVNGEADGAGPPSVQPWRLGTTWRTGLPTVTLGLVLTAMLSAIFWEGSFFRNRLEWVGGHWTARVAHWRHGLSLPQTPTEWALGIGLGRLPVRYVQAAAAIELTRPQQPMVEFDPSSALPGRARLLSLADDNAAAPTTPVHTTLLLSGPQRDVELAGVFAVQQRVGRFEPGSYVAHLRLRPARPLGLTPQHRGPTRVLVKLCEKHQIYERTCYGAMHDLMGDAGASSPEPSWQNLRLPLTAMHDLHPGRDGFLGPTGDWVRPAVLSVSVLHAGHSVEIAEFRLTDTQGRERTQNADFAHGLAHWLEGAGGYYLPWHIDNVLLEWLIERGWLGLAAMLALLAAALLGQRRDSDLSWVCATALVSALLLGGLASLMDAPRPAFLLCFLALSAASGGWRRPESVAKAHQLPAQNARY
jgi:hypothetical protein